MAQGTTSGLLDTSKAQSVFKHALLSEYIIPFAVMTASKLPSRRAVLVDGYAGRGRYDDGKPASAEHLLRAAEKTRTSTNVEVFLVESARKDYRRLAAVAQEYVTRGVKASSLHGDVQDHLPTIIPRAEGASLFLFLDPCGANLPFEVLRRVLGKERANPWPRTEAMLNISADFTRRAAGAINKGLRDHEAVPVLNEVCGGTWWQQVALEAHAASPTGSWESAADAVVEEYARRLGLVTRMQPVVVPVRRQVHHQPVYHLVFLTRSPYGKWVLATAAAAARLEWLKALGPDTDAVASMLFDPVAVQIDGEAETTFAAVKRNLTALAASGQKLKLVDHTGRVFGDRYGLVQDDTIRKAARELRREGVVLDTSPKQVRDWLIG